MYAEVDETTCTRLRKGQIKDGCDVDFLWKDVAEAQVVVWWIACAALFSMQGSPYLISSFVPRQKALPRTAKRGTKRGAQREVQCHGNSGFIYSRC